MCLNIKKKKNLFEIERMNILFDHKHVKNELT